MNKRALARLLVVLTVACSLSCRTGEYSAGGEGGWLAKGHRYDKNGWIYLHIEGGPFERGFQRGYLTANEIEEFLRTLAYTQEFETAKKLDFFVEAASRQFKNKIPKEYVEEMRGMVAGMEKAGKKVTYEEMLFMNGFIDILWYWWPAAKEKDRPGCSAFVAAGDATADGKIVMAHNSWIGYPAGRFCNIIVLKDLPAESWTILPDESWTR